MSYWNELPSFVQGALSKAIDVMSSFCVASKSTIYVLLDRGNVDILPVNSSRWTPVPDAYFAHEPWLAPQLLSLNWPDDLPVLQEALGAAVSTAPQRLQPQCVCAALLSPHPASALLDHFVGLGLQHDPAGVPAVLRYQDPRVMQRVWPALREPQRALWLGPIARWHAALQPEGAVIQQRAALDVIWDAEYAALSQQAAHTRPHHLLDDRQWRLTHSAPAEAAFWQLVSTHNRSTATFVAYPSVGTLRHWLSEAAAHGLERDRDQCDWALCQWQSGPDQWGAPTGLRRTRKALDLQRRHAGLGFGDAWRTVA